jgi:hypothetical protein
MRFPPYPVQSACGSDLPDDVLGSLFEPVCPTTVKAGYRVQFWVDYDACFENKTGRHIARFVLYCDDEITSVRDCSIATSDFVTIIWETDDSSFDAGAQAMDAAPRREGAAWIGREFVVDPGGPGQRGSSVRSRHPAETHGVVR